MPVFFLDAVLFFLSLSICLVTKDSFALDAATLNVGSITGQGWKLEGVAFAVVDINQKQQQFKLSATKLILPKPFDDLKLAEIRCDRFIWQDGEVSCVRGRASLQSAYWRSPSARFSFHLGKQTSNFTLEDIHFIGSRLAFTGEKHGQNWVANIKAKHVNDELFKKLLQATGTKPIQAKLTHGYFDVDVIFSGYQKSLKTINVYADIDGLTGQLQDGKVAAEKLKLQWHIVAKKILGAWYWQSETKFFGGAFYIDPLYIEPGTQPIRLTAQGVWNSRTNQIIINSYDFLHPNVGGLSGNASGFYHDKFKITKAEVNLHSESLQGLVTTYLHPFFTDSPLAGLTILGCLGAKLTFNQETLADATINFNQLYVEDEIGRFAVENASGSINWSSDPSQIKHSEIIWQHLTFKGIPLDSANIRVNSQGKQFELADKVNLPVLGGSIHINHLTWLGKQQAEPDLSFTGAIDNVSLEKLSKSLGWTPLSGNISGQIPGVNYRNKILSLDGELLVNVFDGIIKINNLSASGLFSDFPKINSDIAIEHLDLEQLTRKFEFGTITGRLSGYINNLILENWHPVGFYAWLGTPDDDDSSHSISQKAVNNIASIGGGGATDLLSRSFLGFFETFRYDKIGVGCYLHNSVCQMMGVAAEQEGYYLIKGGCLPRIDVLGYNTQVNWDVLVERLARVASPDKAIIQ